MSGSAEANSHQHSVGFNLGAIALVLALTAVGIAYAIDAAARTANNADRQATLRPRPGRDDGASIGTPSLHGATAP